VKLAECPVMLFLPAVFDHSWQSVDWNFADFVVAYYWPVIVAVAVALDVAVHSPEQRY